MEITTTFQPADRAEWRAWLEQNHDTAREIWLLLDRRGGGRGIAYLDAVEEAICFGWIDGLAKSYSEQLSAQRFTPRRKRSNWTELNKARARRLIRLGLMTDAGRATLPDLDAPFTIAGDIERAIRAEPGAWENYIQFPELYRRVRISNIEDVRKSEVDFERRLDKFVSKTARNEMYGSWNDGGRLGPEEGA
jgi:uncharacterized protein YdeI (YjbR/CyaY-like superfamily)